MNKRLYDAREMNPSQSTSLLQATNSPQMTLRHAAFAVAAALALLATLGLAACASPTQTQDSTANDNATAMDAPKSGTENSDAYHKITADEAQALMNEKSVTIVDVRTPQEYDEGHIPGAINIPVENISSDKPAELTDTDAELIVYCRTGVRSKQASDKLVALGYAHVNDMGGIVDWNGETVSGSEPGGK